MTHTLNRLFFKFNNFDILILSCSWNINTNLEKSPFILFYFAEFLQLCTNFPVPLHALHFGLRLLLNIQGSVRFCFHLIFFAFCSTFSILNLNADKFPVIFIAGSVIQVGLVVFDFLKLFLTSFSFDNETAICSNFESFHQIVLAVWVFFLCFLGLVMIFF